MSLQMCRDQRKLGQMVDQMKILANNLDELRAEISALKASYLTKKDDPLRNNDLKQNLNKSSKTNVLSKLKKYMKKVKSMYSLRKEQKRRNQEPFYPCSNIDPPLSSFLNYIFPNQRKDIWKLPPRIKYLKSRGNQTNDKQELQCTTKSPTPLNMDHKLEDKNYHEFCSSPKRTETDQDDKVVSPSNDATLVPHCSEISCELDVKVENSVCSSPSSNVNIYSDSYTFAACTANVPRNGDSPPQVSSSEGVDDEPVGKQSATKSTQTKITNMRRNSNDSYFKQSNLCFSKIKNAVITKKIVKNSNESTFTICGEVSDMKHYPCPKKNCNKYSFKKKQNSFTQWNDQKTSEQDIPPVKTQLKEMKDSLSGTNNKTMYTCQNILPIKDSDSSPSLVSLDLEVNISNISTNIEDCSERRKPRTYVIRQISQKSNESNWLNDLERITYAGPSSDLSLSCCSFKNHNVHFD
ncbi:uncharacterized protein LOC102679942 [Apis dorsata]|uniref:uncharacterized protein LOC102679942 n=1 Tax=Apis dorsata TaxID=7462 RepID=UPI00129347C2|nr:uncharacterized protein LOC102679942 [Apis dorsata]